VHACSRRCASRSTLCPAALMSPSSIPYTTAAPRAGPTMPVGRRSAGIHIHNPIYYGVSSYSDCKYLGIGHPRYTSIVVAAGPPSTGVSGPRIGTLRSSDLVQCTAMQPSSIPIPYLQGAETTAQNSVHCQVMPLPPYVVCVVSAYRRFCTLSCLRADLRFPLLRCCWL
jgi:hypothetical protein